MVLHKGMPTLKVWKGFAGFEVLCMSVLRCDPASYTRSTDNGRGLSILIDHVIVISRTTRFPSTGREGLRRYEFPKLLGNSCASCASCIWRRVTSQDWHANTFKTRKSLPDLQRLHPFVQHHEVLNVNIGTLSAQHCFIALYYYWQYSNYKNKCSPSTTRFDLFRSSSGYCIR